MKKFYFIFLSASLILSACTQQANNKQSETTNQTETETKMKTINLTKAEFLTKVADFENNPTEWKYLGDKPAIIDFYADWCGPCKAIAPILEELAGEYAGQILIYKVNVDKEQELAALFGIRSIPALLFIPMNEAPQMTQGALPKTELRKMIEEILLKQ